MSIWWDDPPSDDDIEQKGGPSMRFLYQVENILCQPGVAHCGKLYPDYQNRWNQAVPKLRQYLSQQKILGFFACDECSCHGSGDQLGKIIDTVRGTFPVGQAIIYANECSDTFGKHSPEWLPKLDWVSVDRYRYDRHTGADKKPGYVATLKKQYEKEIYPHLHDGQKVAILPMAGRDKRVCDDKCIAALEVQDAKDAVAWINSDSRVALLAPYAWVRTGGPGTPDNGLNGLPGKQPIIDVYSAFGKSTKN